MTEKAILEALQKAVIAAAAAASIPTASVKYVGRNFTPPADAGAWLEVIHIPNNVTNEFWAEGKTYQGIMRLILHWPMTDKGAYAAITLAENVMAYFTKGSRFADPGNTVQVKISDNPNLLSIMEEAPELLLPISIRYSFFKAP